MPCRARQAEKKERMAAPDYWRQRLYLAWAYRAGATHAPAPVAFAIAARDEYGEPAGVISRRMTRGML